MHRHRGDTRPTRALATPVDERVDGVGVALEVRRDGALVVVVAHPTVDAQSAGLVLAGVAEAYALHVAVHLDLDALVSHVREYDGAASPGQPGDAICADRVSGTRGHPSALENVLEVVGRVQRLGQHRFLVGEEPADLSLQVALGHGDDIVEIDDTRSVEAVPPRPPEMDKQREMRMNNILALLVEEGSTSATR